MLVTLVAAAALVASCGGAERNAAFPQAVRLIHNGISLAVPEAWHGRILYLDPDGKDAIFQVANFELPPNSGFDPPQELPPGSEDPIKSMSTSDILVSVATAGTYGPAASLPPQISEAAFVPPTDSPPTPRGHQLAHEAGCFDGRCIDVTVDFGTRPPAADQIRAANDVLRTLVVVHRG